jgi:hypothetical protein
VQQLHIIIVRKGARFERCRCDRVAIIIHGHSTCVIVTPRHRYFAGSRRPCRQLGDVASTTRRVDPGPSKAYHERAETKTNVLGAGAGALPCTHVVHPSRDTVTSHLAISPIGWPSLGLFSVSHIVHRPMGIPDPKGWVWTARPKLARSPGRWSRPTRT